MAESTDESSDPSDDEDTSLEELLAVGPTLELDRELELPMLPPLALLATDIQEKRAAKRTPQASTLVGYRGYVGI